MECRYIRSKFTGYADGDLQPADRRFVDRHIDECPECRRELQALTHFLDDCHEFLVHPGPAYDFDKLRARMATIEPLQEVAAFLPRLKVQGAIPRFAVAALLMVLVGATPGSLRNTRQLYAFMKSPFSTHMDKIDDTYREYLAQQWTETAGEEHHEQV